MKKKFSAFLLCLVMFPLVALFGCDEVSSYSVTVSSSSTIHGSVSGAGTYEEGSTVTLTANAKGGSSVVAWVYQNSTQLQDGDVFSISDTTNEANVVTSSTLTFTMNATTQGSYTAVFSDSKMMYVKLDSYFLTTNPESAGMEDDGLQPTLMTANIDVAQGQSALTTIFTAEGVALRDGVIVSAENITGVLNLSTTTAQNIRVNVVFTMNERTFTFNNLRASLLFQEDVAETSGANHTYSVSYSDGTYRISFNFTIDGQNYHLILNYCNLA